MAHIRQSRPDSGLDFQAKVLKTLINNSVSGNCMENVRGKIDMKIATTEK